MNDFILLVREMRDAGAYLPEALEKHRSFFFADIYASEKSKTLFPLVDLNRKP